MQVLSLVMFIATLGIAMSSALMTIVAVIPNLIVLTGVVGSRKAQIGRDTDFEPGALPCQISLAPIIRQALSPTDGEVGLFYLGGLSYYLQEFDITDFLGLADPVIAHSPVKWGPKGHNKWNLNHSLVDRNVAVIPYRKQYSVEQARTALEERRRFAFYPELSLSPIVTREYEYISSSELGVNHAWGMYVRRDLVRRFRRRLRSSKSASVTRRLESGLEKGVLWQVEGDR